MVDVARKEAIFAALEAATASDNVELSSTSLHLDLTAPDAKTYAGTSTLFFFVSYGTCTTLVFHADSSVSFSSLKVTQGKKTAKIQSCIRGRSSHGSFTEGEGSEVILTVAEPGLSVGQWSVVVAFQAKYHEDTKCGLYHAASGPSLPVPSNFPAIAAANDAKFTEAGAAASPFSNAVPYQGAWSMIASHFEVTEARMAFPCVDDAKVRAPLSLSVSTLRGACVIGNVAEALESRKVSAAHQVVTFEATEALPAYVFGFVLLTPASAQALSSSSASGAQSSVLLFEEVREAVPRNAHEQGGGDPSDTIDVAVYRLPGSKYALAETMKFTVEGLQLLTKFFNTPLPHTKLDTVAVPTMCIAGMENDGIIFLTEKLGLLSSSKKEQELDTLAEFVAHELAHHWAGNMLGLSFGIKEGVCLLLEKQFGALLRGKKRPPIGVPKVGGAQQEMPDKTADKAKEKEKEKDAVVKHQAEEGKELTGLTYQESEIAMARTVQAIGFPKFRKGLGELCVAHAGTLVDDETFGTAFGA